jgi:signal transduction histidine kinase
MAKSRFLASMSHHLRTPLNAVLGFADALKAELVGKIPDEAREYLDDIESAGEHLLALMDDILDITAVETEELRHELRKVDLGRLLRNSLAIVKERATKRGVALELHLGAGVDGVFTLDERALKQILFNYLSNAIKFTPSGGRVSLAVTIVDGMSMLAHRGLTGFATDGPLAREDRALLEAQRFFCLAVSDTGPGITPEDQQRLFQPYSQTDLATGKEGTGLGLVMVKRLAEMCGGAVALRSTPGQGSTFYAWVGVGKGA